MGKIDLNRMLDIAFFSNKKTQINENIFNDISNIEYTKKANNGKVYAIVKENRSYFIKVADYKPSLTLEDFKYMGDDEKFKPRYKKSSYKECLKSIGYMIEDINRQTGVYEEADTFISDNVISEGGWKCPICGGDHPMEECPEYVSESCGMKHEEEEDMVEACGMKHVDEYGDKKEADDEEEENILTDDIVESIDDIINSFKKKRIVEKKYVLKTPKAEPADEEEPAIDMGGEDMAADLEAPAEDMGADVEAPAEDMGADVEAPVEDMGADLGAPAEGGEEDTPKKKVERLTGRLGQVIRNAVESEDFDDSLAKYVFKGVLSALPFQSLDSETNFELIKYVEDKIDTEDEIADIDTNTPTDGVPMEEPIDLDMGGDEAPDLDMGGEEMPGLEMADEEDEATAIPMESYKKSDVILKEDFFYNDDEYKDDPEYDDDKDEWCTPDDEWCVGDDEENLDARIERALQKTGEDIDLEDLEGDMEDMEEMESSEE